MRLNNSRWKEKDIGGALRRTEGLCPLTPGRRRSSCAPSASPTPLSSTLRQGIFMAHTAFL